MKWEALANGEVDEILKNIPNFKETKAKDLFKGKIGKNESGVINLDDSTGPGSHFTAYFNKAGDPYVYYFDSYGMLCPSNIEKYLKSSGKPIKWTNGHLQKVDSSVCGYYCAYFINEMNKGTSFYDLLKVFDVNDQNYNDNFIKKYSIKNFSV